MDIEDKMQPWFMEKVTKSLKLFCKRWIKTKNSKQPIDGYYGKRQSLDHQSI